MNRIKHIHSFILIAIYALGLGHQMVSFSGVFFFNHGVPFHHHESVSSIETMPEPPGTIKHSDHFDEGIYDFLACLFGDQPVSNQFCNLDFYLPGHSNYTLGTDMQLVAGAISSTGQLHIVCYQETSVPDVRYSTALCTGFPDMNHLRGPPATA